MPWLQPMGLGDVLDSAFRLLRTNFARITLVVLAAGILEIPAALVQGSEPSVGFDPFTGRWNIDTLAINVQLITLLIVGTLMVGAITRITAASYLGQSLRVAEVLKMTLRHLPALLLANLLIVLILFAGGIVSGLAAALLFTIPAVGAVLGTLLLFGVVLGISALLMAAPAAIVVEHVGPIKGIGRSFMLMSRRFWQYALTLLLAGLIVTVVATAILGAALMLASLIGSAIDLESTEAALLFGLVILVAYILVSLISMPFILIAVTLLYFDSRIRFEGFDLQVLTMELARGHGS